MRQLLKTASLILAMAVTVPAAADWRPCSHEGSAELLYWRPCLEDLYFTILGPDLGGAVSTPTGVELAVRQEYHPGVRASLGAGYGDRGFRFRWELLSTNDSRTVTIEPGQVLWVTRTSPDIPNTGDSPYDIGNAFSRVQSHYYALDFEAWRAGCPSGPFGLTSVAGLRWAAARYLQFVQYNDLEHDIYTQLRDSARVWGVGPFVATEATYCLCQGLSLYGDVRGGLLVGGITSGTRQSDPGSGFVDVLAVDREWSSHTLPLVSFKTGARYAICLCGAEVSAGIYYEIVRYFDAIQRIRFPDSEGEAINTLSNTPLAFEGLSLALSVDY